jgi:hypothetical protein
MRASSWPAVPRPHRKIDVIGSERLVAASETSKLWARAKQGDIPVAPIISLFNRR